MTNIETREVIFEVEYNPKLYVEMSKIMSRLDLGITNVVNRHKELWSYITYSEVDELYEAKMVQGIREAVESLGNEFLSARIIGNHRM